MGVKGFYGYIKHGNIKDAIKDHSIEEILREIRDYKQEHGKSPKILFNLRAINNYYEETITDVVYGCRMNKIKEKFEELLGSLKSAGAELLFTSKKSHLDKDEEIRWKQMNEDYKLGMNFVKELETGESTRELQHRLKKQRFYPWQENSILVLIQSAQKFGEFRENECLLTVFLSGHAQTAKEEDVYAICGLDTSYLFYPGDWKFIFPTTNTRSHRKEMILREINKQALLKHFKFNYEQFQLFSALGGKFHSTVENADILKNYFKSADGRFQDFDKIVDFVHRHAPIESLPLQQETIKEILEEIFISPIDEDLIIHFNEAITFKPKLYQTEHRSVDKDVLSLLRNDPFSSFAECMLNNLPIDIISCFLNVQDTDMKSLKDLTIGWIQRTGGILFGDKKSKFPVIYRLQSGDLERIDVEAKAPVDLPEWKILIEKEVGMDVKYKALEFLTNSVIKEENLKKIPLDYLMHVLIAVHLIENDSMTVTEAIAMTKALRTTTTKGFTVYPKKVNVRAYRISVLYETIYYVLVKCLSPIGLKDFIADLTLDNVQFQNIFNELRGEFRNAAKENAFNLIMAIINEE